MDYGNRKSFHIFEIFSEVIGVQACDFGSLGEAEKAQIENLLTKNCKGLGVEEQPLRSYARLKKEFSTGCHRENFNL